MGEVCEQDGEGKIYYWTGVSKKGVEKIFKIWSVLLCNIQEND